jgi:hypothetical protein
MSATAFQPEPSAKAPWTRTTFRAAALAAEAAPNGTAVEASMVAAAIVLRTLDISIVSHCRWFV